MRIPNLPIRYHHAVLKAWHAWVAGGFLVAYLTADEDTYAMHLFAGYAVLAAVVLRLAAGVLAPASSPWRLPRPSVAAVRIWLSTRKGRHPLFAWLAAALLGGVGLAAVTGALADGIPWLEDPHAAAANAALGLIFAHVAFVAFIYGGRRLFDRAATWLGGARLAQSKEGSR